METNKKRRSSILKPQKSRNPMSELEPANDNTATRLLTRRVSFASSNFIKEFAADPEKNTIWNVTYEEIVNKSDSTRSSENAQNTLANQQSQQLIQTTQTSIRNLEEDLATKPQECNTNAPSKSTQDASQASLPENQVIMKSKCQNKTVTEGRDLEFTQLCTPKIQPKFNKTSLDVSTMDFTGFINNFKPPLYSTTVKQDQEVKLKDVTFTETSMDITDTQLNNNQIIETIPLQVKNLTALQDEKFTHKENSLEFMDKECLGRREREATQNMPYNLLTGQNIRRETKFNNTVRLDESMEFTQQVPELPNNKTRMEQSMDFTQMVHLGKIQEHRYFPRILSSIHQNPGIAASQILNKENLEKSTNKTNFFNDSVEFTQKIPLNQYNFQSENVRMGQNQQFQPSFLQKSLEVAPRQLVLQESTKTKLFNDDMNITKSVPLKQCKLDEVENVNMEPNPPTGSITSSAQKVLEITRKNLLNQCNFESEYMRVRQDQQFQQALPQRSLEIAPSQLVEQEGGKTKFFNDSMDFTESVPVNQCNFEKVENLNVGPNQPTGNIPSLALLQRKLEATQKNPLNQYNLESENETVGRNPQFQQNSEIAPNPLVQQESVKTKLFNDTMEFTLKQSNFEGLQKSSDGTQNTALLQKTLEITQSKTVRQDNVRTKLFSDSLELTGTLPLNQYNFEGQENVRKEQNQPSDGTQNTDLVQKAALRITENQSKLFETMEIPDEVSLNSETFPVQYQPKENTKQIHNCTQTWNESAQMVQEISANRGTAIHSMQVLQISGINTRDLTQDVSFPKMCNDSTEVVQESSLDARKVIQNQETLIHQNPRIATSQILNKDSLEKPVNKTKFFNDSVEFTQKIPLNQQFQPTLLQKSLEVVPNQLVLQEGTKTKLFNDSMDFTESVPVKQCNFEGLQKPSDGMQNTASLQKTLEITQSNMVRQENVKTKLFSDSLELTGNLPLNQYNFTKQELNKPSDGTQNTALVQKEGLRIKENQSKLFETMEIPDELPLNSETFLVQHQTKENTKQIHNWTQTWNESAQMVQEMSVNRGSAIHSMSGMRDLTQNVSFPEMCNDSTEVAQESSLGARKVIKKQEESWEKLCNPQLLQEKTTSQEHVDIIPSNKPSWSDSYEVMIKYECEGLLDEITPPLHDSLSSIDCSPLHAEKPILSFSKTEIPFRTNLKDLEVYLENTSVEMEEMNKSLAELKGELLRELTLPQHATVKYEKIDFEALQNYSFEDDMDLASDDSSADDSLLHLKFNSNENDEAALTIREKIQNKNSRCKDYCNIIYAEDSKCKLDTLFGSVRLEVDFSVETGEVNKIEICDRLSDKSKPSALLAHKVFRDTLALKHIRAAVGEHYDILTLMDYIYMNMQKIVDFMSDLDMFEGHFGLTIDSSFSVKFNMVSLTLKILWWITVDLSDMENISENHITAVAEVGSLKEYNVKSFLNNCPRGIRFLSAFINNILSHIELLETQRRKK